MNSKQRRTLKRKYPYVLEFTRPVIRTEEDRENWFDFFDKIASESTVWCREKYGKGSYKLAGDYTSFSIRFTSEKQYHWFILRWL